jgi:hypothetical protein
MMNFERFGNHTRVAGHVSVSFDTPVGKISTSTPEGCLLWLLLQEIRELRRELVPKSAGKQ